MIPMNRIPVFDPQDSLLASLLTMATLALIAILSLLFGDTSVARFCFAMAGILLIVSIPLVLICKPMKENQYPMYVVKRPGLTATFHDYTQAQRAYLQLPHAQFFGKDENGVETLLREK